MSDDALGIFTGKHLVVFGAGYVGGAVVGAALRCGLRVTALTRNADVASRLRAAGAATVVAELQSSAWHAELLPADLVVNCVSSGGAGEAGYRTSYVEGMRSISRWLASRRPAEAFLYTSSTSVYPQNGGVVDETAPTEAAAGNARILLEAEDLVRNLAAERLARRSVVLRLAGIYGPGRHYLLDQLRQGGAPFPGGGAHRLNLVYLDDIVSAVGRALAASRETFDTFNVVDDAPTPKAEVVRWLADRIGVPYPGFSGVEAVAGRRPNPPDRAISNAKAKRVLGWSPRFSDFRAGYETILGA
ncbi:epimerase [Opitutaceae bacterium EW11]|nr:epimerase [Opitutaceae bacterium EW11]